MPLFRSFPNQFAGKFAGKLVSLPIVSLLAAALLIGCGRQNETNTGSAPALFAVQPRVALGGLVELSARTGGRIYIDEVVFHAPTVRIEAGGHVTSPDVLATDPEQSNALFFRYSLTTGANGNALGGERQWDLSAPPGADLVFGFSPLERDADALDALSREVGYQMSPLNGYMALVHGFVAVDGQKGLGAFAVGDGAPAAGDGDGAPAANTLAGDGDGAPAHEHSKNMAGDGDGAPATADGDESADSSDSEDGDSKDSDSEDCAGDGDGAPATSTGGMSNGYLEEPVSDVHDESVGLEYGTHWVPFTVLIPNDVTLRVSLDSLLTSKAVTGADSEGYLPIDLEVNAAQLMSEEVLNSIGDQDRSSQSVVVKLDSVQSAAILRVKKLTPRKRVVSRRSESRPISITGR